MKKKLVLLLIVLIGTPWLRGYDNVTLDYEYPSQVLVGETVEITVTLTNTAGDNVWGSKVSINKEGISEKALPYIDFVQDEAKFKAPIRYKMNDEIQTDQVTLKFRYTEGIRGGTYTIPIVFSGRIGPCKEGCVPLPTQEKKIRISAIVPKPRLTFNVNKRIETSTDTAEVPFILKNTGTGKAKNIVLTTSPPDIPSEVELEGKELAPSAELQGTIVFDTSEVSSGVYTLNIDLTYTDDNLNNSQTQATVDLVVNKHNTSPTTTTPPSTAAPKGDTYYEQGMQYLSEKAYTKAIQSFIEAKVQYLEVGDTEKALECEAKINGTLTSITAEKEENMDDYSLIIGTLAGSALSGMALIGWLYNRKII